jgi:hypothetical protein
MSEEACLHRERDRGCNDNAMDNLQESGDAGCKGRGGGKRRKAEGKEGEGL